MSNIIDFMSGKEIEADDLPTEKERERFFEEIESCHKDLLDLMEKWSDEEKNIQACLWTVLSTGADAAYSLAPNEEEAELFVQDAVSPVGYES